jgi:redox-sensitive bicupin YhaK (pirin superfamily)
VSGLLETSDAAVDESTPDPGGSTLEVTESRTAQVGAMAVRRALPRKGRRTVGPWCFADHAGPADVTEDGGFDIGPHPHIGLQTVTWLVSGEVLHRDSLGSEQVIRPGQLNLMTAGRGVAHAEEGTGTYRGELQAMQLWVAQPDATRHGDPGFEHHAALPMVDLPGGQGTVLVGEFGGAASPARRDTDHVGVELDLHGATTLSLRRDYEYAVIVLTGAVELEGQRIEPGHLAYLGSGRDEYAVGVPAAARAMLLGGSPFESAVTMWWNFVGRDRDEMVEAYQHWSGDDGWFGPVHSGLPRIAVGPPPWYTPTA